MSMINFHNDIPADKSLLNLINELRERIEVLENENVETTNCIYELQNEIQAVDARIDIILEESHVLRRPE